MKLFLILVSVFLTFADKERETDGATARVLRHQHHNAGGVDDHKEDHEAILGSKKVAEIFDDLPLEESKRRLQVLAKKMDLDKDGFIDEHELSAWVEKAINNLDEEEADERMREMDENTDGFVSWDEYVRDTFPDADTMRLDAEDEKLLEEDRLYFAYADVDKDGKMSRQELTAFLNPENHQHMHEVLIKITLKEKDSNGDGAIDLKEFLGEISADPKGEWYAVEAARFKNDYDADGDGLLRGDELVAWLIPDTKAVAEQEAKHLINGADKNQDGKLTIAEVLEAHSLFVGSQATDYGENLLRVEHDEF